MHGVTYGGEEKKKGGGGGAAGWLVAIAWGPSSCGDLVRSVYGGVAIELVITWVLAGWVGGVPGGSGLWGLSAFVGSGIEVTKSLLKSSGRVGEGK